MAGSRVPPRPHPHRCVPSYPPALSLVRVPRLLAVCTVSIAAVAALAGRARAQSQDSVPPPPLGIGIPRGADTLRLPLPPPFVPFGRFGRPGLSPTFVARQAADSLRSAVSLGLDSLWRRRAALALAGPASSPITAEQATQQPTTQPATTPLIDTTARVGTLSSNPAIPDSAPADIFGQYADLGLVLQARLETKVEQNKNDRCQAYQAFTAFNNCRGSIQPTFNFQFNVKSGGVVADRVHVNVDYDSQREWDASNNISVYYQGKSDELIDRLEVGNVTFAPPSSRFITSAVPSGNYGIQATGQLGPMKFRTIVAQQKGNVVKDKSFTVGDQTLQAVDNDIQDYQIEPRRFFWIVDPRQFAGYPNIDILNQQQMASLANALPANVRPTRVFVYRLTLGGQPQNPNGPKFSVPELQNSNRGPVYDLLRENVDYYIDPSQLWIALVRPVNLTNERLVVAYYVKGPDGNETTSDSSGTPADTNTTTPLVAHLLYDPSVTPQMPTFRREIRSVYRLGGQDIQRNTVTVSIVSGSVNGQEKPQVPGGYDTYLQMFGLAQANNSALFDADNRLWPRPSDPNQNAAAGGTSSQLIPDYYLVFPSLQPFSDTGLVVRGNPTNPDIYSTPSDYLYSSQHPPTVYHIKVHYQAAGGGDVGSLMLGSVQIRQNSERVLVDGVPLTRGTDYTVDYDLGRIVFNRPDTLFPRARQVSVQYEENPLFAAAPTSIFGLATQFPMTNGELDFTAISQSQKTTFNRPPLGFEPASSLIAGVSGNFNWQADGLTRALEKLPFVATVAPSAISVSGELATSRPQPNAAGQAYVESFEGEGGITIPLAEANWYYSSQPALGVRLPQLIGGDAMLDTNRAATMAWQNLGGDARGNVLMLTLQDIDPLVKYGGTSTLQTPEQLLWLTLYPLSVGGVFNNGEDKFKWFTDNTTPGRRWRSIRIPLSPSGVDLTKVEDLEFWALIDTTAAGRAANPTLVFDFGQISENSLVQAPDTAYITPVANPAPGQSREDSLFRGQHLVGWDTLNTERDQLRNFNVQTNDLGLPGDWVDSLVVVRQGAGGALDIRRDTSRAYLCTAKPGQVQLLGDAKADCTVHNNRLDEEDLDLDGLLNLPSSQRSSENILRYVVDMSNDSTYSRRGNCNLRSQSATGVPGDSVTLCWIHFRVPFNAPFDSIGSPLRRRIQALRVTMISGLGTPDSTFTRVPIAELKLVGSPWLKRSEQTVEGIGGETAAGGTVAAGIIGTTDQDTSRRLVYVSPPGVTDQTDTKQQSFQAGLIQINEQSLRLLATQLPVYAHAEAYYRFPEGQKNFMGYKELRVWAKGRNDGWGKDGELQFYIKLASDENNFYMYRTPVNAGDAETDWLPEVSVDFVKLYALRAELQNAYLQGGAHIQGCHGADSVLIARTPLPANGSDSTRYAFCDAGYMVYTVNPAVTPPNLAGVQELAVGMVRVDSATGTHPIVPSDTLELWVDDIRLTNVVNTPGYAGQLGVNLSAGGIATFSANVSRIDPNFRQLAQQPSYLQNSGINLASTIQLDRLLPKGFGYSMPFSVSYNSQATDPFFLSGSDVRGAGILGLRTPQSGAQSFSLGLRRITPLHNAWLGPIVNNLSLNGTYMSGSSRSEYASVGSNAYTLAADYNLITDARTTRLPGWLDGLLGHLPTWMQTSDMLRALRGANLRWTPTAFRLTSALARTSSNTLSFLKPASSPTDTARQLLGLTNLWRNGAAVEFRPANALSLRWDLSSTRDLKQYGDSNPTAVVATGERDRLLGLDLGLERERTMNSGISFAPVVSAWLRPRVDFSTTFSLLRDPNSTSLLQVADSVGAYRLPRRFSNSQNFSTGAQLDLGRALIIHTGDSSVFRRFVNWVQPIDISYNRSLTSVYDGTPFTPSLGYQFGLGGANAFRSTGGRLASSAGLTGTLGINTSFNLPFNTMLSSRFNRTTNSSWARRFDNTLGEIDGVTQTFPDLSFRWSIRPTFLRWMINSIGANVGVRQSLVSTVQPGAVGGGTQTSSSTVQSLPISGSVAWAFWGGISTQGGYTLTRQVDRNPGSGGNRTSGDFNLGLGKAIKLPKSWGLKNDLRTSLTYQRTHSQSSQFGAGAYSSVLANNGRSAFSLNADTEVAQNLSFTLQGSRIVNFDDRNGLKFTQTMLSAVLHLQFYAGQLR